ncbi:hypothetical protein PRUPE_3G095200 [Prunus persica]|uniref:Uncharacterized protein n=1 Tax=Prunus persica TaxID=3760 RepID=A0A251PZ32_PRUPE|nr:hypothetical protein PRUPE_3G095200 [Prunus persica]
MCMGMSRDRPGQFVHFRTPDRFLDPPVLWTGRCRFTIVNIVWTEMPSSLRVAVRSEAAIFKRPRKKKTLAELKEEESFLLKERRNLKNQLATLHLTVEKQKATNESLRKIKMITRCLKTSRSLSFQQWPTPGSLVSSTKDASCIQLCLDLQLPLTTMKATTSVVPGESISYQLEQVNAVGVPTKIMPTIVHCSNLGASQSSCPPNVSCKVEEAGSQDAAFSLPDLNLPFGDDPSSEVLYRTS